MNIKNYIAKNIECIKDEHVTANEFQLDYLKQLRTCIAADDKKTKQDGVGGINDLECDSICGLAGMQLITKSLEYVQLCVSDEGLKQLAKTTTHQIAVVLYG